MLKKKTKKETPTSWVTEYDIMQIGIELTEFTEINEYQILIQTNQGNMYVPYMFHLMIF